jgi:hypothetical protein
MKAFAWPETCAESSSQPTHLLGPISDPFDPSDPSDLSRPGARAHATASRALQPNADDRAIVGDPGAPGSHAELSDARARTTAQISALAQLEVMDMHRNRWFAGRRSPQVSPFAQLDRLAAGRESTPAEVKGSHHVLGSLRGTAM